MADARQVISETIAEVRRQYSNAYVAFGSGATSQMMANFNQLGVVINDWASRRANWAARGTRDDGSVYALDRWVTEGLQYAKDAGDQAGIGQDNTTLMRLWNTAKDIPSHLQGDLANAANAVTSPTQWPWYLQLAVGGVGLFYASQIWANFRGRK